MKKIIRKSVWETNSSSSHSISLATEDKQFVLDTIFPDENGIITLNGGEFGWEYFKHNDALTKANYVAVSLKDNDTQILIDVIKEQTMVLDVVLNLDDSYIDHDSHGVAPTDKESIRNFIFNKNSWLFGGNDNSPTTPDFTIVPEYRDNEIIEPPFTYELSIIGINRTVKYLLEPTKEEIKDNIGPLLDRLVLTEGGQFINKPNYYSSGLYDHYYTFNDFTFQQNYSKKQIVLIKDDMVRNLTWKMEEKDESFKKMTWKEREKFLRTEILNNHHNLYKIIKFNVKKIKKNKCLNP